MLNEYKSYFNIRIPCLFKKNIFFLRLVVKENHFEGLPNVDHYHFENATNDLNLLQVHENENGYHDLGKHLNNSFHYFLSCAAK